ncbi:MAG: cobalamin B12-binding domain-containing protein [Candidatus Helarchaeota archaeon]
MNEALVTKLVNLDEDATLNVVKKALDESIDPLRLIDQLRDAMEIIGQKFADKEYYISDMIYAAEIFQLAMNLIEPHMKSITTDTLGKVVIGTAQTDIHDIGKNIVVSLLKCAGFEVYDLGTDVPPEQFIQKIKEVNPDIVGLSGLLTTSFEPMVKTIKLIEQEGLRSQVRVMVGGGPVNEEWAKKAGADSYAKDAVEAVELAKKFCG